MFSRILVAILVFSLIFSPSFSYAQSASVLGLPRPGAMVELSPAYAPVLIKGVKVHADNPLAIDFIVDTGNTGLNLDQSGDKQRLSQESEKLIKYFLAALTLPEKNVWVNLSPYEKDRIIPDLLGQTEMGRDMLAQDYILKQITASLIYPEKGLGKDFWDRVYTEAYRKFGTTQVPVSTFNKVWIVADKATVYENGDTAFVINAHLKVMLEQDYLAMTKSTAPAKNTNDLGSEIVRQIIIPALDKEVNQGKNFANLRQIFHSLILAKWYKQALKQALLNQVYSNKNKVAGVDVNDKTITAQIYAQYLKAYKKGVFNFIKEDVDQGTQQPLPRKYFSGGVVGDMALTVVRNPQEAVRALIPRGSFVLVEDVMGKAGLRAHNGQAEQSPAASYLQTRGFSLDEGDGGSVFDSNSTVNATSSDMGLLERYQAEQDKDLAMTQRNTKWERRGFEENVYTVLSGTNATVALSPDDRSTARSISLSGLDQKVEAARQYLESLHEGGNLYNGAIQVKRLSREVKYGYAIDHDTKTIYLSPSFLLKLERQNDSDNFDFLTRKTIFLLLGNPQLGQRFEYEYAYDHYQARVTALFPGDSEPKFLLGNIEKGILLNGLDDRNLGNAYQNLAQEILSTASDRLQSIPMKGSKDQTYTAVRNGKIAVIGAGESVRDSNREVLKRATDAMYIIGINALDGIVDYRQGAAQSTAQFSSKFNPITIAHTFITILYTYAISGAATYSVNVSEFDPRKKDIQRSFSARMALARAEIESFFHHLVSILASEEDIRKWNGEEVAIIRASKIHPPSARTGQKYLYLYTAGGDHHYVWAPFDAKDNTLAGLVGFDEVSDATRDYYSFYAGVGDGRQYGLSWTQYQALVKAQMESGNRKFYDLTIPLDDKQKANKTLNMEERKRVIDQILAATSQAEMDAIFAAAKILPRLDTDGKMVLARKALPQIDFVLAHTIRVGENFGDALRDKLITDNEFKVFNVDGLNAAVAATNTREGLIAFLFGVINFNLLYGASKPTLKKVFDPSDRTPLETLLRQSPLMLPLSITNMLHDKEADHQRLMGNLRADLNALMPGAEIEEMITSFALDNKDRIADRGKSIVTIKMNNQIVFQMDYQVENTVDKDGNFVNKLHANVVHNVIGDNHGTEGVNGAEAEKAVLGYVKEYNQAIDSALKVEQPRIASNDRVTTPGGIDFNSNQLQLDVQKRGAGVGINFDPEMIKNFENADFQGFMPIIINISPITDISPVLGLGKESVNNA